ncbi:hypothetical protein CJ030_MR8G004875 [Morella rubra]|uniref:Uncharacterized protein n=1 Tax=Morella rubra TaxID=262757 RepID=A0A6A1USV2_9ROSI|nr:hypothetical protein CJ030_MR8G004875 [Morella rubra]
MVLYIYVLYRLMGGLVTMASFELDLKAPLFAPFGTGENLGREEIGHWYVRICLFLIFGIGFFN